MAYASQNHNLPVAVFEAPPPVGYRFHPTEFELLDHYLRRLIHGQPLPTFYPRIIGVDIYADHPSAIWNLGDAHDDTGNGAELHCYFYTALKDISKSGGGKKKERRVGAHGTWHMSCTRDIKVNENQILGYNKYLNYKASTIHPGDVEYEWGMHEFTLDHDLDHALCKITRRIKKKKNSNGVRDESVGRSSSDKSVMLSNQQQQGHNIGFGHVRSSKRGNPAKQPNGDLSPKSRTCSSIAVSAHDEIVTPLVGCSSSTAAAHQQQQLLGNTNQAYTAAAQLERLSQFENSDFSDVLCDAQGGHPQQSEGSIVTTSSISSEVEDFDDIFIDLGDFIELDDVREEDCYQPTVGPIGSQQNTCKRARVEEGTGWVEYDQHMHDARADGAKKYRHC